jgi:hypothetical protein
MHLLLALFNSVVDGLRGLQQASELDKPQKRLKLESGVFGVTLRSVPRLRPRMTPADYRATYRSTAASGKRPATGRHPADAHDGRWHAALGTPVVGRSHAVQGTDQPRTIQWR